MATNIVDFLLGPAQLLAQGMVGLLLGIGTIALEIWLMYQIITMVPPRVKNLIDAIDMELTNLRWYTGLKYRVYSAILQVFLPLFLVGACYLAFCYFTDAVILWFPVI